MKRKLSITISIFAFLFLATGCNQSVGEVKPGDVMHIPFSSNLAIGTDSTIVIVNRESGETLNTINRH